MRIYPLLLAAAAAVSADAYASSTKSSSTFERSAAAHQHDPLRFLREERISDLNNLREPLLAAKNDVENNLNFKKLHEVLIWFDHDSGDNLLMYPRFEKWVEDMEKKHGFWSDEAIVELLGHFYHDHELVPMLEKSTKDSTTKSRAIRLQDAWITSKVVEAGTPTDEVIKFVLKLINLDGNVPDSFRFKAYFRLMERKHDMLKTSTQDPNPSANPPI
ncbi:unnamed protein product [Peronospora destructor]|uniref:RxLR effector protein n=1 Tax=Peronospora destructor TaxID=86335 RepID=A0AAV0T5K6_9STRA|nr:unnamed protein product [Peronospora destructor]